MSGLLAKDFRLVFQRKQFFFMILVIAGFMSLNGSYHFIVTYLAIISAMVAISTLSYDEAENCYAFLMTLPVRRRDYVREKYLFGLFCAILACLVGAALCAACILLRQSAAAGLSRGDIAESLVCVPVGLLTFDVALPMQLKFGAEKARLMTVMVMGVVAAAVVGVAKLVKSTLMPEWVRQAAEKVQMLFEEADEGLLIAAGIGAVLVFTWISMAFSRRIMERKEF